MRRLSNILLSAVLLGGGLAGCYDDKGNYDYKDINEMTFKIVPEAENGNYRYKQPPMDTLRVTYTPEIEQSRMEDESNLEYLWQVGYVKDNKNVIDSVRTKELMLKFPPKETTAYKVRFQVTDISTNISFYKELNMSTVYPYTNSWLVLNGMKGDHRISAIENPDSTEYIFTKDAYMDLGYKRRFQDAEDLIYGANIYNNNLAPEFLQVIWSDSLVGMTPFEMKEVMSYADLPKVVTDNKTKLAYGVDGGPAGPTILVDENKQFYYAMVKTQGKYEIPKVSKEVGSYRLDKMAKSQESMAMCFWDDDRKQFLNFEFGGEIKLYSDKSNEWKDMEVVWMGTDNKDDKSRIGVALMLDQKTGEYWTYHLPANSADEIIGENIGELPLDKDSRFATMIEFEDQFFYTVGSKLYHFYVASKESFELYDAGGTISQLQFRIHEHHSVGDNVNHMKYCLGMVVNTETEGELHEVVLTNAGDVEKERVFTGFGPIQDICFTFLNRIEL